jgi:hypothetical protein
MESITLSNWIDITSSAILLVTFIVIYLQLRSQNKFLRGQLHRDRFDMYWKTYDPISKDEIREFKIYPENWMDKKIYHNKYKGRKKLIRKYLMFSKQYEYLAFSFRLITLKVPDSLGHDWTKKWLNDLLEKEEFLDVHEYYKEYYPELARYIDKRLTKKQ